MSSIADLKATIAALNDAASRGKKGERLAVARAAVPELSLEDTASAEEVDAAIRRATLAAHVSLQQAQDEHSLLLI